MATAAFWLASKYAEIKGALELANPTSAGTAACVGNGGKLELTHAQPPRNRAPPSRIKNSNSHEGPRTSSIFQEKEGPAEITGASSAATVAAFTISGEDIAACASTERNGRKRDLVTAQPLVPALRAPKAATATSAPPSATVEVAYASVLRSNAAAVAVGQTAAARPHPSARAGKARRRQNSRICPGQIRVHEPNQT